MKKKSLFNRDLTLLMVILFYLLPIIFLSIYGSYHLSQDIRWRLFSADLLLAFIAAFVLYVWMRRSSVRTVIKEKSVITSAEPQVIIQEVGLEWKEKYEGLQQQYEAQIKSEQTEKKGMELRLQELIEDHELQSLTLRQQLQNKEMALQESQQTNQELRGIIEKHQHQIGVLESKERELHYEVKTLLQLASLDTALDQAPEQIPTTHSDTRSMIHHQELQVKTAEDASLQLKRCIDIATKMTGSYHLSQNSSFIRDFSVDNFALDQRHLYDGLKVENGAIILFYSPKENKLLFANAQVKQVLGWSPEKFIHSFSEILQGGVDEWRKAISQLASTSEHKLKLSFQSKAGDIFPLNCHLGKVSSGIFRHHVLAVLYTSTTS